MLLSRFAVAGLLSVASLTPALADAPAAQTIDVANYRFLPAPITLTAEQPVTLTFINRSGAGHDFTAKEFFASSTMTAGTAPGGKVALAPHETKSITLIPRRGVYQAHCSHFLHASMGMTDQITVK